MVGIQKQILGAGKEREQKLPEKWEWRSFVGSWLQQCWLPLPIRLPIFSLVDCRPATFDLCDLRPATCVPLRPAKFTSLASSLRTRITASKLRDARLKQYEYVLVNRPVLQYKYVTVLKYCTILRYVQFVRSYVQYRTRTSNQNWSMFITISLVHTRSTNLRTVPGTYCTCVAHSYLPHQTFWITGLKIGNARASNTIWWPSSSCVRTVCVP